MKAAIAAAYMHTDSQIHRIFGMAPYFLNSSLNLIP